MSQRIPVDVITCDPKHYVRCAHMLAVLDLLPQEVQDLIERREWTLRTRDGLRAFRLFDVHTIPTLCIDGRKCFENQVPILDELYLALATAARTDEQQEAILQAWSRTNEEYEPQLADLARAMRAPSPGAGADASQTAAEPAQPPTPDASLWEDLENRQAVDIIKALGHPLRFSILQLMALSQSGRALDDACGSCGLVCATRLRTVFAISAPDLNHHMKILHQAGLVETHRDRAWVHYRLRPGSLRIVADAMNGLMVAAMTRPGAPARDGTPATSDCPSESDFGQNRETIHM